VRILYDGNIYALQAAGGITRYFSNLIGGLPASFRPSLIVDSGQRANYPSHPKLKIYEYSGRRKNVSNGFKHRYSQLKDRFVKEVVPRKYFDVCHPTYYELLTDHRVGTYRFPTVITVWDMINELFPELEPTGKEAADKMKAVHGAQKIICISESTKKDLLERCDIPESKVVVTHLASELDESVSYGVEIVPSRPYYLYVGSRTSYKNFDGLLKAFARAGSGRELALCVVGGPLNETEKRLINDLKLTDHVEHYLYPSDSHLAKLYRCSIALVYPSLYEGFGLPPLEAMACGAVAVASNLSSIPEVVGDAGILFDPLAQDELIEILRSLPADEDRRQQLISRGRQRSRNFSWQRTVDQTIDVYRSVIE